MKGIIFTELLEFVAGAHGDDFVDDLLHDSGMSHVAYTSVGTYDFSELATLVGTYCKKTSTPFDRVLRAFGHHLARTFQRKFGRFYAKHDCVLDLVASIEAEIHVEVRKLYPDADLPSFTVVEKGSDRLVIDYMSCKPLGDLAVGLVVGSAAYYGQTVTIESREISDEAGVRRRFDIRASAQIRNDRAA